MHLARYTFAYHLKQSTDNIFVVDSLGHSRSTQTEAYLKALGDERLDEEMDKLYGS
jgi:integrase